MLLIARIKNWWLHKRWARSAIRDLETRIAVLQRQNADAYSRITDLQKQIDDARYVVDRHTNRLAELRHKK